MASNSVILIMFLIFAVCLFIQVPIGYSIGFACLYFMTQSNAITLNSFGSAMFSSVDSFPLMAIPLFVLTGALMEGGGLARRLINFVEAFIGQFTGGLAMAGIITCAFFGAISGSALATVAAIGSIIVPVMVEAGYDQKWAWGLMSAAGCLGIIIPPSIPMVLYASSTNVSIGTLFMGGFGPGLFLTLALCAVTYFMCKKRGYKGNGVAFSLRNVAKQLKDSIWALIIPVIILGGIYGGFCTPTEAAAVAVVYSALAGKFIYKELTVKKLLQGLQSTAITNATILIVVATATVFGRVLTVSQIPAKIIELLSNVTDSYIILLLLINLLLLVVGCIVDTTAAIIILAPMLYPLVSAYGVNLIHFGLIMVLNLAIGLCTPPVGANLFVASGLSGLPFNQVSKQVLPFLLVMLAVLMAVTFVPGITLLLPKLLGLPL